MSNPLIKIRVAAKNWHMAADLVDDLLEGRLLGTDPGNRFVEKLGGVEFEAFRLRNGGFDLRDYRDDGVNLRTHEFRPECARNVERPR